MGCLVTLPNSAVREVIIVQIKQWPMGLQKVWVQDLHWRVQNHESSVAIGCRMIVERHRKHRIQRLSPISYLILSPQGQELSYSSLYLSPPWVGWIVEPVNNKSPKIPTMQNNPQSLAGSCLCQQVSRAGFLRFRVMNDIGPHLNLVLRLLWSSLCLWWGNLILE